ncbi:hypothetical protein SAMN05660649_04368 [Desulfotomaculum arcticum]|uniref:Phage protein, HK97 gp10 family n=1 Tax=Desulfotruncus arcticus DSM 17038 TaxID=1121424 RepID=A0A1I2YBD2_9FIRM|nr:hypothetical protein [Desulfotruncus arcticus]SFH23034.1 hypothetical protein SAMN05660649_04368 [Desulfotomaculum arcticum] [Desulfotruncus arcticus DSM 17038]
MANISVEVRIDLGRLTGLERELENALKQAVQDCIDDLARTASESAPHDKGILEQSYEKQVNASGTKAEGTVEFAVRESYSGGNYNYAMKMHEGTYNLGPGSQAKPGGTGMSGNHYNVGPKFLERPLTGEQDAYKEHIETELQRLVAG